MKKNKREGERETARKKEERDEMSNCPWFLGTMDR